MIRHADPVFRGGWTMVWLLFLALFAFVSGCAVSLVLLMRRNPF